VNYPPPKGSELYVKSLYIIVEVMSNSLYGNSIRIRTTVHCTALWQGGLHPIT